MFMFDFDPKQAFFYINASYISYIIWNNSDFACVLLHAAMRRECSNDNENNDKSYIWRKINSK